MIENIENLGIIVDRRLLKLYKVIIKSIIITVIYIKRGNTIIYIKRGDKVIYTQKEVIQLFIRQ